jgi:hypothetical protein
LPTATRRCTAFAVTRRSGRLPVSKTAWGKGWPLSAPLSGRAHAALGRHSPYGCAISSNLRRRAPPSGRVFVSSTTKMSVSRNCRFRKLCAVCEGMGPHFDPTYRQPGPLYPNISATGRGRRACCRETTSQAWRGSFGRAAHRYSPLRLYERAHSSPRRRPPASRGH